MRYALVEHVDPALAQRIEGTTDSEWIYALILSQLDDPYGVPETRELADATAAALRILRGVRDAHGIDTSSPVNVCLSTGRALVATRFSFDYGWYPPEDEMLETDLPFVSLWYAVGGEYADHDGELADDGGRPAPLAHHRVGAAHDRRVELARGAGVLDADRRARPGRARVRDARPRCLSARSPASSRPCRSSKGGTRRT